MSEWPENERYFYSNFSLRLDEREWKIIMIICDQVEPAPERSREREREREMCKRGGYHLRGNY
jgi:formylmethanofuran dehydrogenase subunit E